MLRSCCCCIILPTSGFLHGTWNTLCRIQLDNAHFRSDSGPGPLRPTSVCIRPLWAQVLSGCGVWLKKVGTNATYVDIFPTDSETSQRTANKCVEIRYNLRHTTGLLGHAQRVSAQKLHTGSNHPPTADIANGVCSALSLDIRCQPGLAPTMLRKASCSSPPFPPLRNGLRSRSSLDRPVS